VNLKPLTIRVLAASAIIYTLVHIVYSGIIFPLTQPNVGQVVEQLQPVTRQVLTGTATVDHPRQYGPVFLMVLDPVYRRDIDDHATLAWYAFAVGLFSIAVAFAATAVAIRSWLAARGLPMTRTVWLGLFLLWGNFGPLYGVLAIKNVELWELAAIMVGCAAAMHGRRWVVAWAIAAGALMKMLPFVFVPYLLLRDRRTFAYTLAAMVVLLSVSQSLYGSQMGWGYAGMLVRAATAGSDFGWVGPITWHENISLRGLGMKAFGYLEDPSIRVSDSPYQRGYFAVVPPPLQAWAIGAGWIVQIAGMAWVAWMLFRRRRAAEPGRAFWDWAFVAAMLLPLAPQASQDYMVLTLGAFSAVLAGCLVHGRRTHWVAFIAATLLVANIVPRGMFSRVFLVGPMMEWSGHQHLTPAEAYQYFGFPLLGLLLLVWVWTRISAIDDRASTSAAMT
jgi:hypothetical protein